MKNTISFLIVLIMFLSSCVMVGAKNEATYTVGEIVEIGSYPQTQVTDKTLVTTLDGLIPEAEGDFAEQYYSDGTKRRAYDMMSYKDVVYNNEKYRGIRINFYRPFTSTGNMGDEYYTSQDDNGYKENEWYWFKYEPLEWKIFDAENGYALCEKIIDAQALNNLSEYDQYNKVYTTASRQYGYAEKYANTYLTSSLRYWLEHDFTETAFSDSERNSLTKFKFAPGGCDYDLNSAYNPPDSSVTHIALLTYEQAFKETVVVSDGYYSSEADVTKDMFRNSKGSQIATDYAKIQGVGAVYTFWWLATGKGTGTEDVYAVNAFEESGKYIITSQAGICDKGVRPVVCVAGLVETATPIMDSEEKAKTDTKTEGTVAEKSNNSGNGQNNGKKGTGIVVVAVPAVVVGAGIISAVVIRKKKVK